MRGTTRALVAALAAVLLLLGLAGPASADGIGLSNDGAHFGDGLAGPLFDPDVRWVPGDERTARFWVRNDATQAGALRLTMTDDGVRSLLATGDVTVSARAAGTGWTSVDSTGTRVLVDDTVVPPRGRRWVDVRVAFDPASGNESQGRLLDLGLEVSLTQSSAVLAPGAPATGDSDAAATGSVAPAGDTAAGPAPATSGGLLPDTGTAVTPALLLLGALLCAAGFTLLAARRRSEDDERHTTCTAP